MIKIEKMTFTLQQIANSNEVLLTDIKPFKQYIDGKASDNIIGYTYVCVCPGNKYQEIIIKVEQANPLMSQDELEAKGGCIKVKPKSFEGRFYRTKSGEYALSCKASGMEL